LIARFRNPERKKSPHKPFCAHGSSLAPQILHTVPISIRSHVLVTEPFLVVGLIASIRRILVITLEAATLTRKVHGRPKARTPSFALR
jgi:hypothetical protein